MTRPSWDSYFIALATTVATRSEDPKTKVGAVLVSDKRIVSSGYNGSPAGYEFTDWNTERKHDTVLHAELNCIVYAGRALTKGATLYVTHSPCSDCAKVIAAAGIDKVVYKDVYKDGAGIALLKKFGIITKQEDDANF